LFNQSINPETLQTIQAMPKIELHRHLEGSLRLNTLFSLLGECEVDIQAETIDDLRPLVQMTKDDTPDSQHFLEKFNVLRRFYCSTEIIQRFVREIVFDAAADQVRYMELRFTPKALSTASELPLEDIVPLVCDAANEAAQECGIIVRYIASMNRHESVEIGEHVLRAAINNRSRGVVGLDLAGDEANYSCLPFRKLFRRAKSAGLGVTIHAGEWAGARSVWDAIGNLNADRVGHGIKALDDLAIVQVLAEREITLEVCPTSNVLSGVVDNLSDHPLIALTRQHVLTTINTDDPLICDITLSDEIARVMHTMDISLDAIKEFTLRAARASFLPDGEREELVRKFQGWLAAV